MQPVALRRIDPDKNMARFYEVNVSPTLFGEWAVVRRWGRIGSVGRELEVWYPEAASASSTVQRLVAAKRRRGYQDLEC